LRLAVVSPFVDRRHGTERALAELLERLAREHDCEIHLYAQRVEELCVSDPHANVEGNGAIIWHRVPSIAGPHVTQFLAWMLMNSLARIWHEKIASVPCDLLLSPGINCLHPDVVIVHALFCRLQEIAHEEKQEKIAYVGTLNRLHRRLYYGLLTFLEHKIYRDPKIALAAVSKRTARLLTEYFQREDVVVIPNAVDSAHFSTSARLASRAAARQRRSFRDEEFVLLLIGNDWRVKGLPAILEAMADLRGLPLCLLVVGNDAVEPFRARAIALGLQGQCKWELPGADALEFYATADAYLSPSREDSFGLPVAEAMACGLPVITSAFAGVADFIEDGVEGFILREPKDTGALSQIIQRLQSNDSLRHNVGEAAARKVFGWNWDDHAKAVWELVQSAAAKKAARHSG
jgi:glycosyltransferase involved in cell wall biosynthesis